MSEPDEIQLAAIGLTEDEFIELVVKAEKEKTDDTPPHESQS